MTIAWAIVLVAVLYLLDKHRLLKKALLGAIIAVAVTATATALFYSASIGYQRLKQRWEDHKEAIRYECFNPSNRKVHSVKESGPWCEWPEMTHLRGSPLPIDEYSTPFPSNEYSTPIPQVVPVAFGNASCLGHPNLGDYRFVNGQARNERNHNPGNLKATLVTERQDSDGFRIFATTEEGADALGLQLRRYKLKLPAATPEQFFAFLSPNKTPVSDSPFPKACDLASGDSTDFLSLQWGVIQDGERLNVIGRSTGLDGMDHGAAWYKVRTEDGRQGYVEYGAIKCDGAPESCKCGGNFNSCSESWTTP